MGGGGGGVESRGGGEKRGGEHWPGGRKGRSLICVVKKYPRTSKVGNLILSRALVTNWRLHSGAHILFSVRD